MSALADAKQRERLRTEFDTTFFVEAGAGTGKTTEIVARIVALVAAGRLVIRELVAITFTEASAAELRARIREGLEVAARELAADEEKARCAAAARDVSEASIDTIHAFAGTLLRTYPLEAGLPPNFEMLDATTQDTEFRDHFRSFFDSLGAGPDRDLARRALLLGLTPDQLEHVARGLYDHYDLLTAGEPWSAAGPALPARDRAHDVGRRLAELAHTPAETMSNEPIVRAIQALRFAADRLADAADEDDALAALRLVEDVPERSSGNQAQWRKRYGRGADAVLRELKDGLKGVEDDACEVLASHRQALLTRLLRPIRLSVLDAARLRKRRGVATFHDLLTWARDLLRDDRGVRERAQHRWSRIFIDEFQDTDPLQAEIAIYLASVPGSTGDWRTLPLVPGKLCVVGDPKQSIYRFRRADIALYQQVQRHIGTTVDLVQNFRSVPRVIDLVNAHYSAHMIQAPDVQPAYVPLTADAAETDTGIWVFGDQIDAAQAEVWEREARDVGRSARSIVDARWQVSDGKGAARTYRDARFRDIAVLIPSRTNLARLERSFRSEGVPYRLESGELIVQTQEVRDLVACLRAIDDPSDEVALIAALRSLAYGVSDVELLQWVDSGGRWSYETPGTGTVDVIRAALTDLRELHLSHHRYSVAGFIQQFIDRRMLVSAAFAQQPRYRESWRRYRYVVDRARGLSDPGTTTLRGFVDWMETLQRDQVRDVSPALSEDDEDAVRVLTVHGSKGLEFPVVVLTGWGSARPSSAAYVLADRVRDRLEVGIGERDGTDRAWATAGFAAAEAREKALAEAEAIRLSYVAMTRARDHLLISRYRKLGDHRAQADTIVETLEREAIAQDVVFGAVVAPAVAVAVDVATDPVAHEAAEREWQETRSRQLLDLRGLRLLTATGLKDTLGSDGEERESPHLPRFPHGRAGTSLGRAVHAVLQTIDLATLDGLMEIARIQAEAEGVPERAHEVEQLVRRACESEAVQRALASGQYWREVPMGARIGETVLEGFIDLLYMDDGAPVVVDYKTDAIRRSEVASRLASYVPQGSAYALLVEAVVGRPVKSVEFVFASVGTTERVENLREAVAVLRHQLDRPG